MVVQHTVVVCIDISHLKNIGPRPAPNLQGRTEKKKVFQQRLRLRLIKRGDATYLPTYPPADAKLRDLQIVPPSYSPLAIRLPV